VKKLLAWMGLFGSLSTLLCCALPALLVALGLGGALAGLVGAVPQLIWISAHKPLVFGAAGFLLLLAGIAQWRVRNDPCPIDPAQAAACRTARRWSLVGYFVSLAVYAVGSFFAFVLK